jgi:Spy/CpxP family protein refolding chaperone
VKFAGDALGDVPLTISQRAAIESLATDSDSRHASARSAQHELTLALAAQVQVGQLDRATLQPQIDQLVAALRLAQPAERAALEQLHVILTPDQRVAFVDALQARMQQRMGGMWTSHPLQRWAADLKLTEAQRAEIKAGLRQRFEAMHGGEEHAGLAGLAGHPHGQRVLEAFRQDRFVLDEIAPAQDPAKRAARMSDRMFGLVETVLPILTPEQRAMAAQKIRERAESLDDAAPVIP